MEEKFKLEKVRNVISVFKVNFPFSVNAFPSSPKTWEAFLSTIWLSPIKECRVSLLQNKFIQVLIKSFFVIFFLACPLNFACCKILFECVVKDANIVHVTIIVPFLLRFVCGRYWKKLKKRMLDWRAIRTHNRKYSTCWQLKRKIMLLKR